MDEIEEARINAICGEGDPLDELSVPLSPSPSASSGEPHTHSRRVTISEAVSTIRTFATVTLPSLALHPSAPLPHVGTPAASASSKLAAHRRAQTDRAASLGAAKAAKLQQQRPRASTAPDDWGRHILDPAVSAEGSATDESAHGSPRVPPQEVSGTADAAVLATDYAEAQAVSAEKAPLGLEGEKEPSKLKEAEKADAPARRALVTAYPPIVRDDRPVSHLRYRNPAEHEPLARSLWLPRDPLKPVDLGDTIQFHGRALVSSAGGRGIVGQWDEAETEDEDEDEEDSGERSPEKLVLSPASLFHDGANSSPDDLNRVGSRLSGISLGGGGVYTLRGTERVRVAADVAAKAQQEEPAAANLARAASRASSIGRRSSTGVNPSRQHSPVLLRHPNSPRPSPPAIPSFSEGSTSVTTPDEAQSSSAYPFPPPVPGPYLPQSETHLSPPRTLRHRSPSAASSTPAGPTSPVSPTSPASPTATTRTGRSASVATSMRSARTLGHLRLAAHEAVILEDAAGEAGSAAGVSVSQSAAVRSELLEEERRSHLAHQKQEEYRQRQERRDREEVEGGARKGGSWFRRLLAKQELEEQTDET